MALTLLIFLATAIIAGTNTTLLKFSVSQFPPIIVFASRFSLASLILLPIVIIRRPSFDKTHISSPVSKFVTYSLRNAITLLIQHEHRHINQAIKVKANKNFPTS